MEEVVLRVGVWVLVGPDHVEGGAPGQHLVEEDAERPPVHGEGVVLAAEDLGGDVVRSACGLERPLRLGNTRRVMSRKAFRICTCKVDDFRKKAMAASFEPQTLLSGREERER